MVNKRSGKETQRVKKRGGGGGSGKSKKAGLPGGKRANSIHTPGENKGRKRKES